MASHTITARKVRRTGEKVHRRSKLLGYFEKTWFQPTNWEAIDRWLLGLERYERKTRRKGSPNGALGYVALKIGRYMAKVIDHKTGRLDPRQDTIADAIGHSRSAVGDALKRMQAHGFLDWTRRYVPTGNLGAGPQVEQTSNAYRISLPKAAAQLLGLLGKAVPVAADLVAGCKERARQIKAYADQDDPITAICDAALAKRRERESSAASQSPLSIFLEAEKRRNERRRGDAATSLKGFPA